MSLYLKVIENGTISLYDETITMQSAFGGSTTTTVWYVSKGTHTVVDRIKFSSIAFNQEARKNILEDMLKDNKAAYTRYTASGEKFSFRQIRSLLHFYNTGVWVD